MSSIACFTTAQAASALDMPFATIGTWASHRWLEPFEASGDVVRAGSGSRAPRLLSRNAIRALSILRAASLTTGVSADLPGLAMQATQLFSDFWPHVRQVRIAYTAGPDSHTVLMVDPHLMATQAEPDNWLNVQAFNLAILFGRVDAALDAMEAKNERSPALMTVIAPSLVRA